MRKFSLPSAIVLSIVTLGIYFLVLTYRNSRDIHEGRPGGRSSWKMLFWLGFVTFGITWIVLTVFNFLRVGEWREELGQDNTLGIVALVLYFVTGFIGAIVWALHWNDTVERLEGAADAPVPAAPAMAG